MFLNALMAAEVDVGSGLTDDFQNTYAFDPLNRETQVIQQSKSGGYAVGYKKTVFAYDSASRLTTLTDYKDSTTAAATGTFAYDHDSRLIDLKWTGPGGPYGGSAQYFDEFQWSFDSDSRTATYTDPFRTSENLTYTYDHDAQLTSAAAPYGGYGGGLGGGTYGWDGNGNSTLSGHVTGKGNRLLSDGTYHFTYDESGHMIKRVAISGGAYTEYAWDNRGRLVTATDKNSSGTTLQLVANSYDMFNDLIGRTLTPYSGGTAGTPTTARFVYDLTGSGGVTWAGSPDPATGGGNAVLAFNGNESLTDRYLWGPAVDQILADERYAPSGSNQMPSSVGTTYFALGDNEWSVRDWITYGSLVDHVVYDSFGKVYSHSNSSITFAFGHNGVFYDPATGLEYHSQSGTGVPGRWYNPAIQRWMSEDPTGLRYDSNPYRSDYNSPTNFIDPSGLDATFGGGDGIVGLQQQEWQQEMQFQQWLNDINGAPLTAGLVGSFFDTMQDLVNAAYGGFCAITMRAYTDQHNRRAKYAAAGVPWIPEVDHTGRIHEDIPPKVPLEWGEEGVRRALEEVTDSLQNRSQDMQQPRPNQGRPDGGGNANHHRRFQEETRWRRQLEERLRQLTPAVPNPDPLISSDTAESMAQATVGTIIVGGVTYLVVNYWWVLLVA